MPEAHVFPGGRVDDADGDNLRFRRAAIRECAEECGLLFAKKDERYANAGESQACFEALKSGASFYDYANEHQLTLCEDELVPFSRWVTPEFEKRRYNAHFFLAKAPSEQVASFDNFETTEGVWLTPNEALKRYAAKEIYLAPPTLATLEDLSDAQSFDDMAQKGTGLVDAICPQRAYVGEQMVLALCGDPLFVGEGARSKLRTRFVHQEKGRFVSGFGE